MFPSRLECFIRCYFHCIALQERKQVLWLLKCKRNARCRALCYILTVNENGKTKTAFVSLHGLSNIFCSFSHERADAN